MTVQRRCHFGWPFLLLAMSGAAGAATEYGTVVSSTPVLSQVSIPERSCIDEEVTTAARPRSGAGAVVGAVIGGVIGNQVGHGTGRAAATGIGAVLGAAVGDHAEADAAAPERSVVQRCRTTRRVEDRLVGYDVVYEHNGVRRSARLPQDPGGPGARIAVEVQVTPSAAARSGRVGTPVPSGTSRRSTVDEEADYADEDYTVQTRRVPYPYYVPAPVVMAPPVVYGGPVIWIGGRWGHHHGHHHRGHRRHW
jgi:uncharacterized protein YcfJ